MFTPQNLFYGLSALALIVYVPALVNPKVFRKEITKVLSDDTNIRLVGMFALMFSFIFLSVKHTFDGGWVMLIALFGWLGLLKGVVYLWSPDMIKKIAKKEFKSESSTIAIAILAILLGLGLAYVGYNLANLGEIVAG